MTKKPAEVMDELDSNILSLLGADAVLTRLRSIAEVERVFTTSGRFDFLLQVACPNTVVLDQVLDQIGAMTGVRSSESLIHLSTKIDRAV